MTTRTLLIASRLRRGFALAALALACSPACSDSGGGSTGSGGNGSAGRANDTGGVPASGGSATGGPLSSGGGGGSAISGGTATNGGSAVGGTAAGGSAAGGLPGTGGTTPVTGGSGTTGGATNAGTGGAENGGSPASTGGKSAGGASPSAPCDAAKTVAGMKIGWNLGNSLDSNDASRADLEVETAWGNPRITPELLKAVAAAGFGAVRIPVTWIGRFGAPPEYRISDAFISRVEQVVNYALEANLYTIINIHHDGAENVSGEWLRLVDDAEQVTEANNAAVLTQFKAMWVQIAAHFENYGDRLLFESMNEIKVGYGAPIQAYYDQVNALNQAFVETVRAGGGYNSERCLVVPGYNTNIEYTLAGFVKPDDEVPGRLILSDHYYDPWTFAGEGSTKAWGAESPGIDTWGQEDWVRSQVEKLKAAFIDKGLPMIWGEYGAVHQTGSENYRRYYLEYVTKAVHDAGIAPFVWDNGSKGSGAEAFGLFDRAENSVLYPVMLEALMRAVNSPYTLAEVAKP